jgi:hypothetical protein
MIDRGQYYVCINSKKMKVFVPMFFTLLAMTVGILTVYFTSPKPSMFQFDIDFELKTYLLSIFKKFN